MLRVVGLSHIGWAFFHIEHQGVPLKKHLRKDNSCNYAVPTASTTLQLMMQHVHIVCVE